ncbi:PKD domain-containing protein [Saccharicrinis sp. 156]|uniref:PKD domain-containing protein n=1 Tax=Saccharicrinis sp. 156 TaxID=3417574 RepID=UPI003D3399B4
MNIKLFVLAILLFSLSLLNGQSGLYVVKKASFSTKKYDEFAPVLYKDGIVFCSNIRSSSLVYYSNDKSNSQFNIYYIKSDKLGSWRNANLLSKQITSKYNDGPVTFSSDGNTIYYSRNMIIGQESKHVAYSRNKLGIFRAVKHDGKWSRISEFRINNDWFNVTTPCLSPDGSRMYFSSDKPDGYGGADLYYCEWINGNWGEPVNMGSQINTSGNESYPYVNHFGELFFSSDGHPGLGGKDIFVTKQKDLGWYPPVRLESPINSQYDDFGIVTDTLMTNGYFSSNREKTFDIYSFKTLNQPVWFSHSQLKNNYCVSLSDTGSLEIDTIRLQYEWEFEDGVKLYGKEVKRCFNGKGDYNVKVNLIDRSTKQLYFHKSSYVITVMDIEQPYINTEDFAVVGEEIKFDGLKSNYPGCEILDYYWQMDDTTLVNGAETTHVFKVPGQHNVKLGIIFKTGVDEKIRKSAVSKEIIVFKGELEKKEYLARLSNENNIHNENHNQHIVVNSYVAKCEGDKEVVYRLQLLTSEERLTLHGQEFKNVPLNHSVKEVFNEKKQRYSYVIDEQMDFMSVYPTYKNILAKGFSNAQVICVVLTNPAEIELYKLVKRYGVSTDDYFNSRNVLQTKGILILNKIIGLLHKNPELNLEIRVHTDNTVSESRNRYVAQFMAQRIKEYISGAGINEGRVVAKGMGEEFPVDSNLHAEGKKRNRRVEFKLIK